MLFKMSEDQKCSTTAEPTIVVAEINNSSFTPKSKCCVSKKAVVIAVACVVIVGLLVAGALVAIRLYFDGKTEELKYSMTMNGIPQNVSTSDNVVTYHAKLDGVESWVVQDFEKELQTIKFQSGTTVGCLVTALNRSAAMTPESVTLWAPSAGNSNVSTEVLKYTIISEAISDQTFLGPKASTLCQNIPTYHAARSCDTQQSTNSGIANRQKRYIIIWIHVCVETKCYRITLDVFIFIP